MKSLRIKFLAPVYLSALVAFIVFWLSLDSLRAVMADAYGEPFPQAALETANKIAVTILAVGVSGILLALVVAVVLAKQVEKRMVAMMGEAFTSAEALGEAAKNGDPGLRETALVQAKTLVSLGMNIAELLGKRRRVQPPIIGGTKPLSGADVLPQDEDD